ncbi:MAG: ABC transporter permease subunit [Pirellulaceae bacterium]
MAEQSLKPRRYNWTGWFAPTVIVLVYVAGRMGLVPFLEPRSLELLANTIRLGLLTSLVAVPIGLAIALLLHVADLPGKRIFWLSMVALFFTPVYLQVAAWDATFGLQGWISNTILDNGTWAVLSGWTGAVVVHAACAVPWTVMLLSLGLRQMDGQLVDAMALQNKSSNILFQLLLPLLAPWCGLATLWIMVTTATEITVTDVYQIRTFAEEVYTGFALGDGLLEAQARTVPAVLLMICLLCCLRPLLSQTWKVQQQFSHRRPLAFQLHRTKWIAWLTLLVLWCGLTVVPISGLVVKAGIQVTDGDEGRIRTWQGTKLIENVISSPVRYADEFGWSFLLCSTTALLVTGLSIALVGSRRYSASQWMAWPLIMVGLAVPGPVLALSIGWCLNHLPFSAAHFLYDQTIFAPVLALVTRSFPLAYLVTSMAWQALDRSIFEQAELLGLSSRRTLAQVALPQILPSLIAAWLIATTVAFSDLSATILAVPPGVMTLSIRIFNLVHYGVEDRLAGLCLAVAILVTIVAVGIAKLLQYED